MFVDILTIDIKQILQISPEKLVEIYCSHADTFEETVQEILSKAVLEVCEQFCILFKLHFYFLFLLNANQSVAMVNDIDNELDN